MAVKIAPATLKLHQPVTLAAACSGFPKGTKGTVVEVYPGAKDYMVELFNSEGETLDVIDCASAVLLERSTNRRTE